MSDDGECFGNGLGEEPGRRRVLPPGFADLPPGPRLAAAVASVDRAACNGYELEELLKARRRLICWLDAECLADANELAYASPGMPHEPAVRTPRPDPMTAAALEPLLGWTGYHADWYLAMATALPRLPRVREALASGGLEINDARTIVDRIADAKPDLWGAIEDAVFPAVLNLRAGLLRAKVEAEVVKADPKAAAKRHKASRSARDVAIWPAVDGVADLAVRGLSADQAAEAFGYVDAIARAFKSTGDSRKLGQLRADVAAALLTGAADIRDCSASRQADKTRSETEEDQAARKEAAQNQADREQSEQCIAKADASQGRTDAEQGETGESTQGEHGTCPIHWFPDHEHHHARCDCGDCAPAPAAGEPIAHFTPCRCTRSHDTAAHDAAERNATASTGAHIPQQKRRPDEPAEPPLGRRTKPPQLAPLSPPWSSSQPSWGGIRTRAKVQLNIPLTTLMGLSTQPGELGGFGPVILEVTRRIVANNLDNPEARFSVGVTHPVTGRLLHLHPIPARFLRGLQAELVHARDQRCVWTTCRRPAATCHLDHNTEHQHGGATSVDNVAPRCPRHHKAKTDRNWKLQQTGPGEHTLTDPYGRKHHSRAPSLTDPAVDEPTLATTTTTTAEDDLPPF